MNTSQPQSRPTTSKARGICKYYTTERGCFNGKRCKFIHGNPLESTASPMLTPYDQSKTCRFYAQGYCRRGDACWFRHEIPEPGIVSPDRPKPCGHVEGFKLPSVIRLGEDEDLCCICLEKPSTYGLLEGCNHVFCLHCIRQWRDPIGKSLDVVEAGVNKKCPLCRSQSRFITPSSLFFGSDSPGKARAIAQYKASMARTPCRYFENSKRKPNPRLPSPFCPFGKDCFYRHQNDDGTMYIFLTGVDHNLRKYLNVQNSPYLSLPTSASASEGNNPDTRRRIESLVTSISGLWQEPIQDEATMRRLTVAVNTILDLDDLSAANLFDHFLQSTALSRLEADVQSMMYEPPTAQTTPDELMPLNPWESILITPSHSPPPSPHHARARRESNASFNSMLPLDSVSEPETGEEFGPEDDSDVEDESAYRLLGDFSGTLSPISESPHASPDPAPLLSSRQGIVYTPRPGSLSSDGMPDLESVSSEGSDPRTTDESMVAEQDEPSELLAAPDSPQSSVPEELLTSMLSRFPARPAVDAHGDLDGMVSRWGQETVLPGAVSRDEYNLPEDEEVIPDLEPVSHFGGMTQSHPPPVPPIHEVENPQTRPSEPSFVTDGRGRVISTDLEIKPPAVSLRRSSSTYEACEGLPESSTASSSRDDGSDPLVATASEDGTATPSLLETVCHSLSRMFDI